MTYAPGWDCDMRCVRSSAHLRLRTRAHKLVFTPRIVIETNSPAHAESSPHVRRTLDINRESDIHAVAGTLQTPISIYALREESDQASAVRRTGRPPNPLPCGCWALSMVAASVIASAPSALFRGCEWWVRDSNPRCVSVGDLQAPAVAAGPTHQKCDRIYKDRGPLRR